MDRKKFRELTFKQKIEWLVHYYGVTAIVAVIALVVVISLVKTFLFPDPLSDMVIVVLSENMGQLEADELQTQIEEKTGKTVLVSAYIVGDVYGQQAFSARVTADTIDVIIAPENERNLMEESGYLTLVEPLSGYDSLYIGTTMKSRQGELLDETYKIVKEYFENRQ